MRNHDNIAPEHGAVEDSEFTTEYGYVEAEELEGFED